MVYGCYIVQGENALQATKGTWNGSLKAPFWKKAPFCKKGSVFSRFTDGQPVPQGSSFGATYLFECKLSGRFGGLNNPSSSQKYVPPGSLKHFFLGSQVKFSKLPKSYCFAFRLPVIDLRAVGVLKEKFVAPIPQQRIWDTFHTNVPIERAHLWYVESDPTYETAPFFLSRRK